MPTIVLVHGAWCDGSSWSPVIEALLESDHEVVAVQNPLTSLADDIASTQRSIADLEGPLVLVGHSYGGAVISAVAAGRPDVSALVYVAAYAPDEDETVQGLGERVAPTDGAAAIRPDSAGFLTLDRSQFPTVFAGDVDPSRARVLAAVQAPTHFTCFGTPLGPIGWRDRPTVYVRSEHDRMVSPELQSWMAERLGGQRVDLPSSHASPLSHPGEIAAAVLSAARAAPVAPGG